MLPGATIAAMNLSIAPLDIWLGGLRIIRAESHLIAGLSRWPQYRKRASSWAESCPAAGGMAYFEDGSEGML
jgi:hypothetical protein